MDVGTVNLLAILFSPVIAVGVSLWFEHRKERRQSKLWILNTLMQTRHHTGFTDEQVRALNMIDVVFRDAPEVRRLWHEYFGMLGNEGLQNPLGYSQRGKKYLEMIVAMARDVGYGRTLTHLDIDRVYAPVGLGKYYERNEAISDELLRVLKASHGFSVTPAPPTLPPSQAQRLEAGGKGKE